MGKCFTIIIPSVETSSTSPSSRAVNHLGVIAGKFQSLIKVTWLANPPENQVPGTSKDPKYMSNLWVKDRWQLCLSVCVQLNIVRCYKELFPLQVREKSVYGRVPVV